jgi:hypothetical protein
MKSILPTERVLLALSIPLSHVDDHIKSMQDSQCHLTWIDVSMVNHVNYFNFLWMNNTTEPAFQSTSTRIKNEIAVETPAQPPRYVIFYDMNTAQMARLHHEYSVEKNWNLELVEPYLKVQKPPLSSVSLSASMQSASAKRKQNPATAKSYDEMFFICQFKYSGSADKNQLNKLQHSVIDTRFSECMQDMVKMNYTQLYMPVRVSPLLMHVNTATNKHIYYTTLYKPIEHFKMQGEECSFDHDFAITPKFTFRKNLDDTELIQLHQEFNRNQWKLVDLKAYKNEAGVSKFAVIWASIREFYEGSSILMIGLESAELIEKVNEMEAKKLYPKLITNYGYINSKGEHVFAALFCQF